MLEIVFSCPRCSRMFLQDGPPAGLLPLHHDPLLGLPCAASGAQVHAFLELAGIPS